MTKQQELAEIVGQIKQHKKIVRNYKGDKVRVIEGTLVDGPKTVRKGRREDGHGW